MPHKACMYRGFAITGTVVESEGETSDNPPLPARAVARRGRIRIEEPQPIAGIWDAHVRYEIDRLLDPAVLRDVDALN